MARLDDRWLESRDTLVRAAQDVQIDAGLMAKVAGFESGYDSAARPVSRNPAANRQRQFDGVMAISTAYGYGQFLDRTWQEMINRHGERHGLASASTMTMAQTNFPEVRQDRQLQAAMLAEFTRENIEKGARLGGPNADANVYAFHNLGDRDASRLLNAYRNNANQRVDAILSRNVISGNRALYGDGSRTVAEAYATMGQVMARYEEFAHEAVGLAEIPTYPFRAATSHHPTRDLQQSLIRLGIPDADGRPLTADGNLGPRTQQAIEAFQRQHGMPVDGKATPQLLAATQIAVSVTDTLHGTQQFGQRYGVQASAPPHWAGVPHAASTQPAPRPAERIAETTQFDGVRSRVASTEEMRSERPTNAPVGTTVTAYELDRDSVAALQRDLNRLGFTDPRGRPLADDGRYGPNTQAAVMAFQREQGLPATGVADPTTLSAVNAHAIVASLAQQRDARDAQDAIERQAQAFDARRAEPRLHGNDPMNRESATIHATRLPHANDFSGLRGTYTPPSAGQLTVEQDRPSMPGRDTDAIDHTSVRHVERGPVGFDALRGAAVPPEASRDARDPQHPDHAFYRAIADKLPGAYAEAGLVAPGPEAQERVAASLSAQARSQGVARADHVVIGGGEHGNVFVVQGRLDDPAHLRAHLPLQEAQRAPQQESFQHLRHASHQFAIDQQAQHERAQQRSQGSGMSM